MKWARPAPSTASVPVANASNTPWRLYKHFNHEGGIASPGIFHWLKGISAKAGNILHNPAHIIDLLPTAIAVSGAKYEGKLDLPGQNLIDQFNKGFKTAPSSSNTKATAPSARANGNSSHSTTNPGNSTTFPKTASK